MNSIWQALELLNAKEKRHGLYLFSLSTFAAAAQTVAILSIMPFIVLLSNPSALDVNESLARIDELVASDSTKELLVLLGVIGISALAIGNVLIALENWLIRRYLSQLGHRIERDLLQTILNRPFEYFSNHHSGRLSNLVLDQVDRVVDGVLGSLFGIVSNTVLTVFIVFMLLIVSFKTTLATLVALLFLYLTVFLMLKRRVAGHGKELTKLSGDVHTTVKETLEGIREIKMGRAENFFVRRFDVSRVPLSRLSIRSSVLEFLPNFILETLVFSVLVGVGLYFVLNSEQPEASLSYIALYGLATYRLVPALNGIFEGLTELHHDSDAVRLVNEHFANPEVDSSTAAAPRVHDEIHVRNVSYQYPNTDTEQLAEVNLELPAGTSICLFGKSGSGKSTLLNILAGLVRPTHGTVSCDDTMLSGVALSSWRERVGFCPQQICLFEGPIASNIAFGVEPDQIDLRRVAEVANLAMLEEFIATETSHGYQSVVGERGNSLSGGQRQRVGIARALYKKADVLIFDESFVGLDVPNQEAILDNLFALQDKIIIMSTHDVSIARRCDKVVLLEKGRVVAEGNYEELSLPG